MDRRLAASGPLVTGDMAAPTVLIAFEERNRMTYRALSFAMTLSPDVIAIHILHLEGPDTEEDLSALRDRWDRDITAPVVASGATPPRLMCVPAPDREINDLILDLVEKIHTATPGRSVAIFIPELVTNHLWEQAFHSRRARRLRRASLHHAPPRVMIISSAWRA